MTKVQLTRWLLLPFAVWASWALAVLFGFALLGLFDTVCPTSQVVSGHHCNAPWYPAATEFSVSLGSATAAFLILVSTSLIAPSHKQRVATTVLVAGILVAAVAGVVIQAWFPAASAIATGLATYSWLKSRKPKFSRDPDPIPVAPVG